MTDKQLAHYGVKGMRWGVRRSGGRTSSDYKKTSGNRNRDPRQLSNHQLKETNARINLEQNYRRLNPSKVQRGAAAATAMLGTLEIGVRAYNLYRSPAGQAAIKLGKSMIKT